MTVGGGATKWENRGSETFCFLKGGNWQYG